MLKIYVKHILLCLLYLGVFISCTNTPQKDYIIFSGIIEDPLNDQYKLVIAPITENSTLKEIKLDENGAFSDTLRNLNGYYRLFNGNQFTTIYLKEGHNLTLNMNAADKTFDESIVYSGKGKEANNYLAKKYLLYENVLVGKRVLYSLKETAFLDTMNSYKNQVTVLLNEVNDPDFVSEEKRDLDCEYIYRIIKEYSGYHKFLSGDDNFKVSSNYPKLLENFDPDNLEHYKTNAIYYRRLSLDARVKRAKKIAKKEGISIAEASLQNAINEEHEHFKNESLIVLGHNMVTPGEDPELVEKYYQAIMTHSTDSVHKNKLTQTYNKLTSLYKGKPSPKFVDYENYNGGVTSLDDFKGKYVYIDMWATWCVPCLKEIPALKKLEKQYHGKNIEFVSISIDKQKDRDKWKKMVHKKELTGVQLFADKSTKSEFYAGYGIKAIPRFIIIDPEGNIVSDNAPKPSDPKLINIFSELEI